MLEAVHEARLASLASEVGAEPGELRATVTGVLDHMRAFGPRRSVRAAAELLRLPVGWAEAVLGADYRVAS